MAEENKKVELNEQELSEAAGGCAGSAKYGKSEYETAGFSQHTYVWYRDRYVLFSDDNSVWLEEAANYGVDYYNTYGTRITGAQLRATGNFSEQSRKLP